MDSGSTTNILNTYMPHQVVLSSTAYIPLTDVEMVKFDKQDVINQQIFEKKVILQYDIDNIDRI